MGRMPTAPKLASFPAIRGALRFYQVCSVITGIGLLLLVTEMVLKYSPLHIELFAGGSGGGLWFASVIVGPDCQWWSLFAPMTNDCELVSTGDGFNLSQFILVAHGWFYVVYLFSCFRVWSLMRWRFPRFLLLALGGVIPFLSFVLEAVTARRVKTYLDAREAAERTETTPDAAAQPAPAGRVPTQE
jgi:integral membrane protein